MEIAIVHKNIDWVFIVNNYDYIPEQKETGPTYASGGEPGFPEGIAINEYYLELHAAVFCDKLTKQINDQLFESTRLAEHIFKLYQDNIGEELLEMHHEGSI